MSSSSGEDFNIPMNGNDEQCPPLESINGFGEEFEQQFGKEGINDLDRCIGRDVLERILKKLLGQCDHKEGKELVAAADSFYKTAQDNGFTMENLNKLVPAACLYLAFREKSMEFLLIDIANSLCVTIHELGSVYFSLRDCLKNTNSPDYEALVQELTHRESEYLKMKPKAYKEKVVICMHEEQKLFRYGLCESCYNDFVKLAGEVGGDYIQEPELGDMGDRSIESDVEAQPEPALFRKSRRSRQVISSDDEE